MNTLEGKVAHVLRKNKYAFTTGRNESVFRITGEMWGTTKEDETMKGPWNDFLVPKANFSKRDPDEVIEEAKREREVKVEQERIIWEAEQRKVEDKGLNENTPMPSKTKPMIDFSNKVYIAPLTTVGNLPFRRVMKNFGADITCAEMCLCSNLLQGQASEAALLKRHHSEDVFGVQLAGGFSDQWARCAELIDKECGDVDFIDMNCGCPLDLVCDKGAGSAMMNKPNKMKMAITAMANKFSGPVTVKMRTGWDEKKPFADTLTAKVQGWELPNVAAMMVHGRSRLQRYSKLTNWDYIGKVAKNLDSAAEAQGVRRIPLIGNGDIMSWRDFEERRREGVMATAMVGRGALIKPWLPDEIKGKVDRDISASERLDLLKNFVNYGLEHWGSDQQGVNTTRRFLLEWLSFLCRYVPVGLMKEGRVGVQRMNERPPYVFSGRSDLETLMASSNAADWVKISELLLGKVGDGFKFEPKHKSNSYGKGGEGDRGGAGGGNDTQG